MSVQSFVVTCPKCGAKNRIPHSRSHERAICGRCREPLSGSRDAGPVEVSDRTFQEEVLSNPYPVLLDCWAPWCGPCRAVAPALEQLARDYQGRVKIAKLNVDENPMTASRFQIQSIPTMLLFKNGVQVDRLVGALPKQEIERHMQRLL